MLKPLGVLNIELFDSEPEGCLRSPKRKAVPSLPLIFPWSLRAPWAICVRSIASSPFSGSFSCKTSASGESTIRSAGLWLYNDGPFNHMLQLPHVSRPGLPLSIPEAFRHGFIVWPSFSQIYLQSDSQGVMSSFLILSYVIDMGNTFYSVEQVLSESLILTSVLRSRLVAAITLTST